MTTKQTLKNWIPALIIVACAALQIDLGLRDFPDGGQLIGGGIFVACLLFLTYPLNQLW